MQWTATGLTGVLMLVGCAAPVSSYVPPHDGRARPLFRGNRIVVEMSGGALSMECLQAVLAVTGARNLGTSEGYVVPMDGIARVVEQRGLAPPPTHTAPARYYLDELGRPRFDLQPGAGLDLPRAPGLQVNPPRRTRKGGYVDPALPRDRADYGKRDPMMGAILGLPMIYFLPGVFAGAAAALPIADSSAMNASGSGQAVDQVNAYNDLVRTPGSPCGLALPDNPSAIPLAQSRPGSP